jgi:hypothetical protein
MHKVKCDVPAMRGFDGAVSEMFLDSEEINPALRNGDAHHDILAWNLPQLAARETRHQDIALDLNLANIISPSI